MTRIDEFGGALATYAWTDCGGEDWDIPDVWVDFETNEVVSNIPMSVGEALWTQGESENQGLQSAGQVDTDDATVQLRAGFTLVGNSFPVAVKVNDLIPSGEETYGNISITLIDNFGGAETTYAWTDCGGEDWDISDVWVDFETNELISDSVTIGAGQGLWVQGSSDNQYLTIPAPELN